MYNCLKQYKSFYVFVGFCIIDSCIKSQLVSTDPYLTFAVFIIDTIRYLSLHDNKYIRYFPGHNKR